MYESGNVRMLAFFIPDSISALASRTKELAMDATFGTNNTGADLFAVLAEVDGTGVQLAYCFVDVFKDNKGKRNAAPGAIIDVLIHFLQALKCYDLNPTFFGIDKDSAEIFAVRHVWSEATIQLCYWHMLLACTKSYHHEVDILRPDQDSGWVLAIGGPGSNSRVGDLLGLNCHTPTRWRSSIWTLQLSLA
jgi:hypothetical protein